SSQLMSLPPGCRCVAGPPASNDTGIQRRPQPSPLERRAKRAPLPLRWPTIGKFDQRVILTRELIVEDPRQPGPIASSQAGADSRIADPLPVKPLPDQPHGFPDGVVINARSAPAIVSLSVSIDDVESRRRSDDLRDRDGAELGGVSLRRREVGLVGLRKK